MDAFRRAPVLASFAIAFATAFSSSVPAAAQCADFEVTPVPFEASWTSAFLYDVSAVAPDDAWAVGFYGEPEPFGSNTYSLAVHWDGTGWTRVPTQNPSPCPSCTAVTLHGVAAIASDDVWAGGERWGDAGGLSAGAWIHVQHWDGSSWEEVPVPQPPGGAGINFSGTRIYEVIGFASDDVWFGGAWGEPNEIATVDWRPLAMHWDGSEMTIHDTPVVPNPSSSFGYAVRSFSALGPDDIWAACRPNTAAMASVQNVVLHWDGTGWERVDVPDSAVSHRVREVVALAPDDVWLLGDEYFPPAPWALHWDGRSWTEVPGSPFLSCAAATGPGTIYTGNDVVSIFDGTSTEVVETFPGVTGPSVLAMKAAGECSVWAVGRRSIGGPLLPFAARLEGGATTSPWETIAGGVAGGNGMPSLDGDGPLQAGTMAHLSLAGAVPGASTSIVVGVAELLAPFKGGLLVPSPDVLVHGVMADVQGAWSLSFAWPAGLPAGASLWFQAWSPDAAAPAGLAASDGVRATQP
jgi:hypothetical protein